MTEIERENFVKVINKPVVFVYVHTPMCGTCKLARKMLEAVEAISEDYHFHELNASLYPQFLQKNRIKSVPCLLIMKNGKVKETIYSFESVTNIYFRIQGYVPSIN
ncbi:thioredoxin family protein [Aquibacillus albus]|uniref:Thiol-disulfide isomerase/thioredoxin n=1 Tax=Aquibacillus albus TaxID=1168171 RepID=A0ABS2MYN7_9BACI|nr:thioredoxin family protein [Aquibacillus albus]MBM7570985.1 thiol-disulfide isomerase/thioredoxin [Aquibacillus albus]